MRYDLTTLRLFVTAVQDGSIAAAAERHHLAASAVSRRLSDMEHHVGAPLLYRSRSGVTTTPAGAALCRHARNLLRLADRMEAELSEYGSGVRGHVRVAVNTSAVTQFLPDELAAFHRAHPDIRVDLTESVSTEIVRDVADGHADIGLFSEVVSPGTLQVFPYRTDRLMALMPTSHPLAGDDAVAFAETLDFPHVGLQAGSSLKAQLATAAEDLGRVIDFRVSVASFDGLRRMVEADLGIGVLPEGAVRPYLTDRLTARPLSDAWARRRLLLGVREEKSLPTAARRLLWHLAAPEAKTEPGAKNEPKAKPSA